MFHFLHTIYDAMRFGMRLSLRSDAFAGNPDLLRMYVLSEMGMMLPEPRAAVAPKPAAVETAPAVHAQADSPEESERIAA